MQFKGVITSLITPFKGEVIDVEGLRENISFQIKNGVNGLLVGGTTGEAPTLDLDEYELLIQTTAHVCGGQLPLIVSVGESATKRSLIKMEMATTWGADALLVATPAYNRPSQEGLYQHFKTIANMSKLPVILYNNPIRTGVSIELSTLMRLTKIDGIAGIKESSGVIQTAQDILYHLPRHLTFLSGEDRLILPLMASGAGGVISVLSNLMPKQIVEFVQLILDQDIEQARKKERALYPFFQACSFETNPVPIKTMMNLLGRAAGGFRLPLTSLKQANIERLETLLDLKASPI